MKKCYLGCGHIDMHGDGYLNVDLRKLPHVDVCCDVSEKLPFEDNSVDEILADSVLEHLPHNDTTGNCSTTYHKTIKILKEWHRVLKPSGILSIKIPNIEGLFYSYYIKKTCSVKDFVMYLWGGQEYGGGTCSHSPNTHLCGFDANLITELFKVVGFRDIKIRNAHNQMIVLMRKILMNFVVLVLNENVSQRIDCL